MEPFPFLAAAFISWLTTSTTPEIVFLFHILEQLFYVFFNLAINDVIIDSNATI